MSISMTARVMEHVANGQVRRSKHLADIYIQTGASQLGKLELFQTGQTVIKKGYHWYWRSSAGYDIPLRMINRKKYEVVTHDSDH